MDITQIDKNFKIESNIDKQDLKFYDVRTEPFHIFGVFYENGKFRRMPEDVANTVNDGVKALHSNTAGGRIKFKTNSNYVAINAKMSGLSKMPHFAFTGSIGFDLYLKENGKYNYVKTFVPPINITDTYESVIDFNDNSFREILINMPLYSNVDALYIGLSENAVVSEPEPYKLQKPVVYYGSSITQGGCASRPGTSYQALISSVLDCNYINLGFSGSAKGEDEIAEYIADLDMSLFVYDYDHNAPSVEYLEKTHERMFEIIRKKNPRLPVLLLSRPKYSLSEDEKRRLEIIENTYNNAKAWGDSNVYMINGTKLMNMAQFEGTVDDCHPNDFGFASMAKALIPVIERIIFK